MAEQENKIPNDIWYLEGPFHRYEGGSDGVKAQARKAGVKIIDSRFAGSKRPGAAEKVPTAKLKAEFQPKKADK